jgi:hypothetical protein
MYVGLTPPPPLAFPPVITGQIEAANAVLAANAISAMPDKSENTLFILLSLQTVLLVLLPRVFRLCKPAYIMLGARPEEKKKSK